MNIQFSTSKKLHRIETAIGTENILGSKYLIIRRKTDHPGLGLFAYYITMLAWIDYALKHDLIPVIDMQNFENQYHEEGQVGKVNTWELFFEQPCGVSVEEALASGKARYVWSDIPSYHPNDSLDFLYNREIVAYYHSLAQKYIRLQSDVEEYILQQERKIFGECSNKDIIGVLARGTDYVDRKPYYNPIQPDVSELFVKIDEYSQTYGCKKIFVATEDLLILNKFQKRYGECLLFTDQKRVTKVKTELCDDKQFMSVPPKMRGMQYLSSIYLLSRCKGLIAGRTAGTVGAVLQGGVNYEFLHIVTKGRYGIEDDILGV